MLMFLRTVDDEPAVKPEPIVEGPVTTKLREARALIKRGWTKGVSHDKSMFGRDRYCITGAVAAAYGACPLPPFDHPASFDHPAYRRLRAAMPDVQRWPYLEMPLQVYNDTFATKRGVLKLFDRAIAMNPSE